MSVFKKAGVVVTTPSSGTYVIEEIGNIGMLATLLDERLFKCQSGYDPGVFEDEDKAAEDEKVEKEEGQQPREKKEDLRPAKRAGRRGCPAERRTEKRMGEEADEGHSAKKRPSQTRAALAAARRRAAKKAATEAAKHAAQKETRALEQVEAHDEDEEMKEQVEEEDVGEKVREIDEGKHGGDEEDDEDKGIVETQGASEAIMTAGPLSRRTRPPRDLPPASDVFEDEDGDDEGVNEDVAPTVGDGRGTFSEATMLTDSLRRARFDVGEIYSFSAREAALNKLRGWGSVVECKIKRIINSRSVVVACKTASTASESAFYGSYRIPMSTALRVLSGRHSKGEAHRSADHSPTLQSGGASRKTHRHVNDKPSENAAVAAAAPSRCLPPMFLIGSPPPGAGPSQGQLARRKKATAGLAFPGTGGGRGGSRSSGGGRGKTIAPVAACAPSKSRARRAGDAERDPPDARGRGAGPVSKRRRIGRKDQAQPPGAVADWRDATNAGASSFRSSVRDEHLGIATTDGVRKRRRELNRDGEPREWWGHEDVRLGEDDPYHHAEDRDDVEEAWQHGGGGNDGGSDGDRGMVSASHLEKLMGGFASLRREVRANMTAVTASVERLAYELRMTRTAVVTRHSRADNDDGDATELGLFAFGDGGEIATRSGDDSGGAPTIHVDIAAEGAMLSSHERLLASLRTERRQESARHAAELAELRDIIYGEARRRAEEGEREGEALGPHSEQQPQLQPLADAALPVVASPAEPTTAPTDAPVPGAPEEDTPTQQDQEAPSTHSDDDAAAATAAATPGHQEREPTELTAVPQADISVEIAQGEKEEEGEPASAARKREATERRDEEDDFVAGLESLPKLVDMPDAGLDFHRSA